MQLLKDRRKMRFSTCLFKEREMSLNAKYNNSQLRGVDVKLGWRNVISFEVDWSYARISRPLSLETFFVF